MKPEQLKLLKDIYSILVPSNFCNAVYYSPAQSLRNAADEMERKEMLISQFKKELYFWENGEYPKEPEVSYLNLVWDGTVTVGSSWAVTINQ